MSMKASCQVLLPAACPGWLPVCLSSSDSQTTLVRLKFGLEHTAPTLRLWTCRCNARHGTCLTAAATQKLEQELHTEQELRQGSVAVTIWQRVRTWSDFSGICHFIVVEMVGNGRSNCLGMYVCACVCVDGCVCWAAA